MTESHASLVIDAGQSGCRARLVGNDGADRLTIDLDPVQTNGPLIAQLAQRVATALKTLKGGPVHTVAVGSSGLGDENAHQLLAALGEPIRRVMLAHDSVTCYLGALDSRPGCVIAAGTGTICLAVGPADVARVDGWGHLLGDAGSAYWIGRTALEAALRGYDGRRRMTALTDMMRDEFPDLEKAYLVLQADPDRVARIASFAVKVDALAATDRVAGNIIDKAAAHLSEAVQAAIRRVHLHGPKPPHVATLGGAFNSDRLTRRFTDYLALQWPTFALTEPAGTPLDGVEEMLWLAPSHPLYSRISVAER